MGPPEIAEIKAVSYLWDVLTKRNVDTLPMISRLCNFSLSECQESSFIFCCDLKEFLVVVLEYYNYYKQPQNNNNNRADNHTNLITITLTAIHRIEPI